MKKTLLITLLISVKIILSQTYLVPYKIGNKMGLSDELAKLVIKPQYDAIEYLYTETNENYFKYTNVSLKTDTVISYGNKKVAQDKKVYTYGLYKKNKILITNQSCSDFIVYPNFIVASTNAYNALNCVVYNLKGKQLTTEPIYHLLVNEQRVIGKLKNMNSKYSLLSIYQRDDNKNSTFSLALFDNEKQDITQWLLKKVSAFKVEKDQIKNTLTGFTFKDNKGVQHKFLRVTNNKFEIVEQYHLTIAQKVDLAKSEIYEGVADFGGVTEFMGYDSPAVPEYEKNPNSFDEVSLNKYPKTDNEKRKFTYYIKKRSDDSLFFVEPNLEHLWYTKNQIATYIKVPNNVSIMYLNSESSQEYLHLIYKKENKFGILNRGIFSEIVYDSLLYFGYDFIAGIKTNNKMHFGIIKPNGNEMLPIIYDSIRTGIKQVEYIDVETINREQRTSIFALTNKKNDYGYLNLLCKYWQLKETMNTVYKGGKVGITGNNANEIILPAEYDFIAKNNIHYSGIRKSDFYIAKKNNKYNIPNIEFNHALNKYELKKNVQLSFNFIPNFCIDNYYKIKGLKIFGLYDENNKFLGYANENGLEYFEK